MATVTLYPEPLVQKVQGIINRTGSGPVNRFNQVLEVLLEQKIAYVVKDVSPDLMLVHPDNRSKLGVNAFDAHRVGAYIARVGADLQLLSKATAFEIAPADPQRSRQLDFNRSLVSRSAGMLAPVTGHADFAALAAEVDAAHIARSA